MKEPRVTDGLLRFLILVSEKSDYVTMASSMNARYVHLFKDKKQVEVTDSERRILQTRGDIYHFLIQINPGHELAWSVRAYKVSKAGLALIEKNRERLSKVDEKKAASEDKVRRLVIIRKWSQRYDSVLGTERRFEGLFEVTRETGKRLYGRLVWPTKSDNDLQMDDSFWFVRSNRSDPHVERECVTVDPTTREMFNNLRKIEDDQFKDLAEREDQMEAEMEAVRARYEERAKQTAAMYGDMMVEAGLPRETVNTLLDKK